MAAIWKLPIVFICENNQWACGTPYTDVINTQGVAERSVGYGIPGVRIDGNDVLEVWEAIRKAADRARNGEGPSLIECFTFRIAAHNSSDPESRPQELINEWKSKDPIKKFAMYLHKKGVSSTELESIEKDAKAEIQAACEFAEQSPYPDPREVDLFVYSQDNERSVSR
jgi:TPP-dependent pyruvate/acetoin dehydrogenase alpha subunit